MLFKFSIEQTPWTSSLILHGLLLLGWGILVWVPTPRKQTVEIQVIEAPAQKLSVPTVSPVQLPPKPPAKAPKPRAIYGVSRKSTGTPDSIAFKAGNTLAKEKDDEQLKPSDADALPIPTDEYLVSVMPKLVSEARIPYPAEAKEKNIQGVVVMDILVDGEGRVRQAILVSGPGAGLNQAALEAVLQFRFEPARVQDQAVAVRIRYGYRFVLER